MAAQAAAARAARILTLDGGGVRGVLTAVLLQRLERAVPGFLDSVTLFAGTSTGGILALGLASGWSPATLRDWYVESAARAFATDEAIDDRRDDRKLLGADYDARGLRRVLRGAFGGATLGALRRRVVIPAFDLDNAARDRRRREWKPKIFHNYPGADSDARLRLVDVALATCAAPTYFPTYRGYVDGGVVANNPGLVALAQALDRRVPARERGLLATARLLSVGTGRALHFVRGQRHDWGYIQWARPLLRILLDGSAGLADFQCRQFMGARYRRLAPVFPPGVDIGLDDVRRIPELVRMAEETDLRACVRWLRRARWVDRTAPGH